MGEFLKLAWLAIMTLTAIGLHAEATSVQSAETSSTAVASVSPEDPESKGKFILPPGLIPDPSEIFSQLDQLAELINLSPEQLQQLRLTIEFLERLSPQERESMRLRLAHITEVSKARKSEVSYLVPYVPPRFHSDLSQLWMATSDEERAAIKKAIEPLSNWNKGQYLIERIKEFVAQREVIYSKLLSSLEEKKSVEAEPTPEDGR